MTSARPGLAIFDCDGVIVDSEPVASRVVSDSLTRYGWSMDAEAANVWFMGGTIFKIEESARARGVSLPRDWVDEVYAELFEALKDTPPIPGVEAALDALDQAGCPIASARTGRRRRWTSRSQAPA